MTQIGLHTTTMVKGRITIPTELRKQLGVKRGKWGKRVVFFPVSKNLLIIVPMNVMRRKYPLLEQFARLAEKVAATEAVDDD